MVEDRVSHLRKAVLEAIPEDKFRVVDSIIVEKSKNRKKKLSCLVLVTDQSAKVLLLWFKESSPSTRKAKWRIQEIQHLDLKEPIGSRENPEFELQIDRAYKWSALSTPEKHSFARNLFRLSRCLARENQFNTKNDNGLFEDLKKTTDNFDHLQNSDGVQDLEVGEYQALTQKEEEDLERLMIKYEFAISNAEAFTEQLGRELTSLDASNVHAIMESEKKVEGLMTMFDTVIEEVTQLETKLDMYDCLLREVRDSVMRMEEKDAVIHIQNENILKLRHLVEHVIARMDLCHEYQSVFAEPKFEGEENLRRCSEAARALESALAVDVHPALMELKAIKDQTRSLEGLRQSFVRSFCHHINDQLIKITVDYGTHCRRTLAAGEPVLRKHDIVHSVLRNYCDLMAWLKRNDYESYENFRQQYLKKFSQIYQQEILVFFEQANSKLRFEESRSTSGTLDTRKGTLVLNAQDGLSTTPTKQRTTCYLGMASEQFCANEDAVARQMFDLFVERILTQLEPTYLSEQQFCIEFFDLTASRERESRRTDRLGVESGAVSSGSRTPSKSTSIDDLDSVSRTSSDEMLTRLRKRDKDVGQEVRFVMASMFESLDEELKKFVSTYDGVYSMYLLVRLCHHTIQTEDAGSYLCKLYGVALVNAKRNFDQYMNAHIASIQESKPPRKTKCGILSFVSNFEEFANQCEAVFQSSDRRSDLLKWYSKIVHAIFEAIVRVSIEHGRTPPDVICMENYHHMYTRLYQLKILEEERKDAKEKYNYALQAYVTNYFGRPLDKLNVFFEGVQARIDTGTKRSDVCFIHQYSKSELRKVIKEFPGREVKRGLESLYRKVEKHLSSEENLLQVVWRHMQDEFIRQYNAIQALLESCYSGSMISLEFTIEELLEYFSDIAKQH